jgi:NAD(P)H-flavin reductase
MNAYILSFEDVTHNIRVITIQMNTPYEYSAGQYAVIDIDTFGARPFSIASAPRGNNTFDIHVRNSGQNLSHYLCTAIKQGERVHVLPAQGKLSWRNDADKTIFIAGGTGVTPFLAMMEAEPSRPVTLYWGMNSEHEFYIRPQRNGLAVHYCTETYPIDAFLKDLDDNAVIYLSGPPAMVQDSKAKLLSAGVEPSNIIHDEF